MVSIFWEILKCVGFIENSRDCVFILPSPSNPENRNVSGYFREPFPSNCNIIHFPDGIEFIEKLEQYITENSFKKIMVIPPFIQWKSLPQDISEKYSRLNLHEIVLKIIYDILPVDSLCGILLPSSTLFVDSLSYFREILFKSIDTKMIIYLSNDFDILPCIHPSFNMNILFFEVNGKSTNILRLFKLPSLTEDSTEKDILEDVKRLYKMNGGHSKFGYVLRNFTAFKEPLIYEKNHPTLLRKEKELEIIGSAKILSDLVDFVPSLHSVLDKKLFMKVDPNNSILVLSAKNILTSGEISIAEDNKRINDKTTKGLLQEGDILLRAIAHPTSKLVVAEVKKELLPLAFDQTVIALRPKLNLTAEDKIFLISYLSSDIGRELFRARFIGINIQRQKLADLPIPISDNRLRIAFRSLLEASDKFGQWKSEVDLSINSLFTHSSIKEMRENILSVGRSSRMKVEAASKTNDFKYRVRTQYPHPIAYLCRTIEAAHPDLEGYMSILECAEITFCYLACIALLLAKNNGIEISSAKEMAKSLSETNHGTSMGNWMAILREISSSKAFKDLNQYVAFYEVKTLLNNPTTNNLVTQLFNCRNDLAHGRGPQGSGIKTAFNKVCDDLYNFLEAIEFIAEYPLRFIEKTNVDSIAKTVRYNYRDLMGDHHLVHIQNAESNILDLETNSLYLLDRASNLHLLRPFLTRKECPNCGNWATFYLDKYNRKEKYVNLKSIEHKHEMKDTYQVEAFKQIGLIQ